MDRTAAAPLDPYTDGDSSSIDIYATRPFGVEFLEVSEVPDCHFLSNGAS